MTTTSSLPSTSASARLLDKFVAQFPASRRLAEQARELFPNGVTHDARYLEPFPVYIDRALGSRKWTVEGHELIDYWSGHGAILLGHSHPAVVSAVSAQMARSTHPGGCHALEIEWGEWVRRLVPSAERVRFVSSGTEATLMALRLARIFTGKPRVLKFAGHFHGWHDSLIPGADPPHLDEIPGIPASVGQNTVIVKADLDAVAAVLQRDSQIACIILEPTGGHAGAVPVTGDFLRSLRTLCDRHGVLLIFDEVITGFRVAPGGAQGYYGIRPDLTTLAKILAGGLPGGCVTGREDVLAHLESRPGKLKMKHPGTFNANPLSAAAGIATLTQVATGEPNKKANAMGHLLRQRLNTLFEDQGIDWLAYGNFSMFRLLPGYQGPRPRADEASGFIPYGGDVDKLDAPMNRSLMYAFRQGLLLHGVDLMGLGGSITAAHTEDDIDRTVMAVAGTMEMLREEGVI